ncbi:hypothetical protein GCM10009574_078770 [Streptomyces asiaticus]|uniref:Uncharacterized protein n=1 Tax=Streptomyces rhizosphaericus TaxID=114699 RepID=A0ABP3ZGB5_9ACTN
MMRAIPITAPVGIWRPWIVRATSGMRSAGRSIRWPACSSTQPGFQPGLRRPERFSIVLAPVRMQVAHGCLMVMPRIQSPSGSTGLAALMRLAPTGACPGGPHVGR